MKILAAIIVGGTCLSLAASAMAADACVRPTAPAAVDGSGATREQLLAMKSEVTAFIAASDAYQTCVVDDMTAQRAAAKANKTKVPREAVAASDAALKSNQTDKEQVGKAFNAAVKAFNAAHPG